jgi:hypothetical protein
MNEVNEKAFSDSKTIRLFNRYATYNGSNPFKAPGILNNTTLRIRSRCLFTKRRDAWDYE